MINTMENWDSSVNTYGVNYKDCKDCIYVDSCKEYWKQILSNPIHDVEEIKTEIVNFDCDYFYSTDDQYQDDIVDKIYNRDDYGIEYNTYIHEFYEG